MANYDFFPLSILFVGKILARFYFDSMHSQPAVVANFVKVIKTKDVALIWQCQQDIGIIKSIFIGLIIHITYTQLHTHKKKHTGHIDMQNQNK